jgi:hypothetical protein
MCQDQKDRNTLHYILRIPNNKGYSHPFVLHQLCLGPEALGGFPGQRQLTMPISQAVISGVYGMPTYACTYISHCSVEIATYKGCWFLVSCPASSTSTALLVPKAAGRKFPSLFPALSSAPSAIICLTTWLKRTYGTLHNNFLAGYLGSIWVMSIQVHDGEPKMLQHHCKRSTAAPTPSPHLLVQMLQIPKFKTTAFKSIQKNTKQTIHRPTFYPYIHSDPNPSPNPKP